MPLKNRINIILSKDPNYQVKDAIVVHSIEELLEELKKYDEESIYIIGGESIYRQMLPYCDVAHVTKIDHAYEGNVYGHWGFGSAVRSCCRSPSYCLLLRLNSYCPP